MLAGAVAVMTTIGPRAAGRSECFILARPGHAPFVSDAAECAHPTAPASTFKIPHALIALQTGVITATTVFEWDGSPRANESWQRAHTLDSAIKWSVLPFFQNTARLIGRERMRQWLTRLVYAADSFDGEISMFWLNGDLVVSPLEQLSFLDRFFAHQLPVAPEHIATVQRAMEMPHGEVTLAAGPKPFVLSWPVAPLVRSKTGNTTVDGERVSWLIGALEIGTARSLFVARVRSTEPLDNAAAIDFARRMLDAQRP